MPHLPTSALTIAMQRQHARQARAQAQQAQLYTQSGKALVTLSGAASEAIVPVKFVHPFTEEPIFTFGGALLPRTRITNGSFPTVSAVIEGWATTRDNGSLAYLGASIAIVVTGEDGQQMNVHYSFQGNALSFWTPT